MIDAPDTSALFRADPELIEVGVGDIAVASHPCRILTPALGSCVGVAVFDQYGRRGGLAHVMLPAPADGDARGFPGRFATTAVPELVEALSAAGSLRRRMTAKIAGGAAMFRGDSAIANIGERNILEVKRQLELMGVPLVAEDTGEGHARTIEMLLDSGTLLVRSYQFGVRRL